MAKVSFTLYVDENLRRDFLIEATLKGLRPNKLLEQMFIDWVQKNHKKKKGK